MTTLIVALDGTGQTHDQANKTNIARLFDSLGGAISDAGEGSYERDAGAVQGKYLPGVGAVGNPALKLLGDLFGDGLATLIVRGYTWLSRTWQPGDTVVVIGFSRGATAARALAAWVATRGLLRPGLYDPADKDAAYHWGLAAWQAWRGNTGDLAAESWNDFLARLEGDLPTVDDASFTAPVPVAAVGVFDTVQSLGLPDVDPAVRQGKLDVSVKFGFTLVNQALSPLVARGFHALSADERRELFTPTPWDARDGIAQVIFPGNHSDVGGGYAERNLADAALAWMAEQLGSVAPVFTAGFGDGYQPDPLAPAHDETEGPEYALTPKADRVLPRDALPGNSLRQRFGQQAQVLAASMGGVEPRNPVAYAPSATWPGGAPIVP